MRIALWTLGIAAVLLAGCTPPEPSKTAEGGDKPAAEGKMQVAVIPKGSTHEFWKSVHAGANKAGEELGVEIIWKGPLKEDDRDDQIKVVEDFTSRGVDAIVLAPLDDTALRVPVDGAKKAGIQVVIIDSSLKDAADLPYVATNNEEGGYIAGKHLAGVLGGKGKVAMLRYQEGSASTNQREAGFMRAMKESPGIEVVSADRYGGATSESAQKESENLIARFKAPDGKLGLDGIYTPNESTTFGMLRALQDAGFAGKVKFVGFDSSAKLVEGLESGQINGLILQNPKEMGYQGVKAAVAKKKGETVELVNEMPPTLVTPENMKESAIAELLAPPTGV